MSSKKPTPRPKLVNAPPSTNGHATNGVPGGPRMLTANERQWKRYEDLVANLTTLRRDWLQNLLDPRRNVDRECGYPTGQVSATVYQNLFDREPIANRVVQILPRETWQVQPLLYEDESPDVVTPFEQAWDDLARQLRGGSMYQDEAGNPVWEYLLRADVLSGIGQFAVILLGIDDGLRLDQPAEGVNDGREESKTKKPDNPSNQGLTVSKPDAGRSLFGVSPYSSFQDTLYSQSILAPPRSKVGMDSPDIDSTDAQEPTDEGDPIRSDAEREKDDPSVTPLPPKGGEGESEGGKRKLLFIRVFAENLVQISRWNSDPSSPRFGYPEMYRITLSDPTKMSSGIGQPSMTVDVHWSRVIHVADNLSSSEVLGTPRMQPVLNRLLDLQKICGAAGEGYWKQAFSTLVLESNPQLAGDVDVDRADIRDQLENLDGGLQKSLVLLGMQAKTLPPGITDPTPFVNTMIEQICVQIGVPVRVFKGSERGELASSQDDAAWNDRLKARQTYYLTPRVIIPFVDRLIAMGVLPKPKTGKKSMGELNKGKRDADAKAKPPGGAPSAPPAPGEEGDGGDEATAGGPPKPGGGGKPSFPPFKKPGGFGGPPKFNADGDQTSPAKWHPKNPFGYESIEGKEHEKIIGNAILFGKQPVAQSTDAMDPDDDDAVADPDDTDPFGDDADPDAPDTLEKKGEKTTPGYSVEWPDIDSMTDAERAQVFLTRVQAWAAYIQGDVDQMIPPEYAMTHLDQFDDEEAMAIAAAGIQRQEETLAREAEQMEQFGFKPDPQNPGAMIDPEQQDAENEIELAKAENPAGVQQSGPPSPFGQKPGAGGPPGPKKPPPFAKNEATENAFCPTGPGGGQDNSCAPGNPVGMSKDDAVKAGFLYHGMSEAKFQEFIKSEGFEGGGFSNEPQPLYGPRYLAMDTKQLPKPSFVQGGGRNVQYTFSEAHDNLVPLRSPEEAAKWGAAYAFAGDVYEADSKGTILRKLNLKNHVRNAFCPTGEGGGVDPSCSKDNAGDVPEGHTRLFRVEPTITGPKADDSHWLKKHLSPAQFQQFLDEQGGLFTPQLHKLEQYGHGSSGYTTYFVDVPTAEADKYKRTHAEGDWDEYPLPKNMRESKKIYQRKE